ncbi:MAG: sugar phosphate isomerase/epimerase, partial [Acholeplasmataceae bacterium]|nr:sugar phosphate isomerase/epimerase [Acholeplasmataceae bacterium]
MKLGIISHHQDSDLKKVKQMGLANVEFCINGDDKTFLSNIDQVQKSLKTYGLEVLSIGRWGTIRVNTQGIVEQEFRVNEQLIDACRQLGCPIYTTGVNYVEEMNYEDNIRLTLTYLKRLQAYAATKGVKLAVNNCRWENYIVGPDTWDIVLRNVPGLGIKYDPSHAIYDLKNYLKELNDYAKHIVHIHLKGSLIVDSLRVDDPPAGLDMTNWKAFMSILYHHEYKGG